MRPPVFAFLFFIAALTRAAPSALPADAGEPVDFAREIAPIFEAHCVRCHNRHEKKGKFSLGSASEAFAKRGGYERAIVPGDPDNSLLVELITPPSAGAQPDMPEEGDALSTEQIARVRRWIAEGAKWPNELKIERRSKADKTWWSLQPLRPVTIPNEVGAPPEWSQSPIDQFVLAGLRAKGLRPSGRAERRILLRRATFDLTGLPPTPEELRAFLDDRRPDAYERVVDRLLASARYGEHWGRHWLDVVRFGESTGFERNLIHDNAWPFRDYIIRSLNDDKPFDRLIVEHLAGDQLAPGDPEIEVGTGFLVGGPYDNVGNQDAKAAAQIRANTLDEIVSTTASAFLGVTLHCARCHDHKFDPIPQSDYYRVQAAFSGIEQGARELATAAQRDDLAKKRALLDQAIEETKREFAVLGNADATDGAQVTSERKRLSERKAALEGERKHLQQLPTAWIGTFKQPGAPAYLMRGGDPQQRGADIAPGSLAFLDHCASRFELPLNAPEAERRMALAKWIIGENNPLTARVLANRVWHYHFGNGIVDTPNDFGYMGGRPSHPALLDYLAGRLKDHGWRLKPLHREIMLSATYRQSGAWEKGGADADSSARLLWRFPPRRLSAEEVRDTILAVAGKLDLQKMGGPGFRLYRYFNDNVSTYIPLDLVGPETYRRAVYHQSARASTVDLLSDFDAPDCAFSAPRRANTTTPLQALTLFNHAFTIDMAEHFAERLRSASAGNLPAAVDQAFLLVSSRSPSEEELAEAISLIDRHGLRAFCRALLNTSELMYVD